MASLYLNQNPAALPASWLSPALSIVRNAGPDAGLVDVGYTDLDPAINPQVVRALAGADGGGAAATGVQVQLWVSAFGTAGTSATFLASMGGDTGIAVPVPATTLSSGQSAGLEQPWDAASGFTAAEVQQLAVPAGNVHACLYGNLYGNGQGSPRTTVANGPDAWNPGANRLHAQRNITIRAAPPGQLMPMKLWAGNPRADKDGTYVFEVVERSPRELTVWEVEDIAAAQPWLLGPREQLGFGVRIPKLRTLPGSLLRLPGGALRFLGSQRVALAEDRIRARELPGLQALVDGRRVPILAPRAPLADLAFEIEGGRASDRIQKFALGADEARPATVHFELPTEEFVMRIVDVVQRGPRGAIAGGARIVLIAAPSEVVSARR